MHILCSVYNRTSALLVTENNRKKLMLAGQRQEEKFNLDNIELMGLGASGGLTKRNDLLVTAYFYCKDIKTILSMSTLRPYEIVHNWGLCTIWDKYGQMIFFQRSIHVKNDFKRCKIIYWKSIFCKIYSLQYKRKNFRRGCNRK